MPATSVHRPTPPSMAMTPLFPEPASDAFCNMLHPSVAELRGQRVTHHVADVMSNERDPVGFELIKDSRDVVSLTRLLVPVFWTPE